MKNRFIALVALTLALTMIFSFSASAETPRWIEPEAHTPIDDFAYSFAVFGDTQIITHFDARLGTHNLNTMYQWVVDNKEAKKIEYVIGLGDITNTTNAYEWTVAHRAIKKLDGVVGYSLVRGNHDVERSFINTFGKHTPYTDTIEGYYEGADKVLNNYRTLTVCGIKYLIMVLDYYPTNAELKWANQVVEEHPEHRVIVTTHSYLYKDGSLWPYGDNGEPGGNTANNMWLNFLRRR